MGPGVAQHGGMGKSSFAGAGASTRRESERRSRRKQQQPAAAIAEEVRSDGLMIKKMTGGLRRAAMRRARRRNAASHVGTRVGLLAGPGLRPVGLSQHLDWLDSGLELTARTVEIDGYLILI